MKGVKSYDLLVLVLVRYDYKSHSQYQYRRFREEGCKEKIKRARKVAILARRCSEEFKGICDVDLSRTKN